MKVIIHPLFFIFGIYFAFTGRVFSFIIFTLTALIHELGHSYVSERLGYKLNRITLMPYGAVISGDLEGLKYKDEIEIALAGPILNLIIAVVFVAVWWFIPESYAYTELIVTANLSIATVNFLPCYPLDGGRILTATLSLFIKRDKAILVARILGVTLSVGLIGLFVYSCFTTVNFSLLFFSGFVLFGVVCIKKDNNYIKVYSSYNINRIMHGGELKKLVVTERATLKDVIGKMDGESLYGLVVVNNDGKVVKSYSFTDVKKLLEEKSIYDEIV